MSNDALNADAGTAGYRPDVDVPRSSDFGRATDADMTDYSHDAQVAAQDGEDARAPHTRTSDAGRGAAGDDASDQAPASASGSAPGDMARGLADDATQQSGGRRGRVADAPAGTAAPARGSLDDADDQDSA